MSIFKFRVFGTNLDEDDDVDEGESENLDVLDEEAVMDTFTQDNPTNLFASATGLLLLFSATISDFWFLCHLATM